jgi:hypothetical protein
MVSLFSNISIIYIIFCLCIYLNVCAQKHLFNELSIRMPVNAIFSIYGHLLKALTQQFILPSRNLSQRSNVITVSIIVESPRDLPYGDIILHFHWLKANSGNGDGSGKQHKLGQCEGAQQQLTACRC